MTEAVALDRAPLPASGSRVSRFHMQLDVITLVGLAIRLIYLFGWHLHRSVWGDPYFYHYGANLLVQGKGFIGPIQEIVFHRRVQAADHPPLYLLYLSVPSLFGIGTEMVHRAWSTLLGAGTVYVAGLLGKRIATPRVGLISAVLVAILPGIWVYDAELKAETLSTLLATLALLAAYRTLDEPSRKNVLWLGAACGVAALARSELVFLVPALLWPVVAVARNGDASRARLMQIGAGTLVAIAVCAPWVLYNLTRFDHPVYLSSQLGATLAGANCADTYHGPNTGLTTVTCVADQSPFVDQSVTDRAMSHRARTFISDHRDRVPAVVAVRVGRVLGVSYVHSQINADVALDGRERPVAWAILVSSYLVELAAIAGAIVLRRQRRQLFPLLVLPAIVILTVAATYGTNRFRASAETSLAVLAAIAVDALWSRPARAAGG